MFPEDYSRIELRHFYSDGNSHWKAVCSNTTELVYCCLYATDQHFVHSEHVADFWFRLIYFLSFQTIHSSTFAGGVFIKIVKFLFIQTDIY